MLNWDSNVFPGILGRTCDRPCEPACRRVRTEEKPVAICRLEARRRRSQGRHLGLPAPGAEEEERQAHLPHGRGSRLAGGGPGSPAVRLRDRYVRPRSGRRRHDAEPNPGIPAAGGRAGGGGRPHPRHGRQRPVRLRDREHEGNARRWTTTPISSAPVRPGDATSTCPGRQVVDDHISIGIDWLSSVAFGHTYFHLRQGHRHGRGQYRHGLLPHLQTPRCRASDRGRPFRVRRHEGVRMGEGRRHGGGHPDHQQPAAEGVPARQRPADRLSLRVRQAGARRHVDGTATNRAASPTSSWNATTS